MTLYELSVSPAGAVVLVLVTLAAVFLILTVAGWRPLLTKRRVIVVLKSGESIRGVLIARRPDTLILDDAEVLSDGVPVPVDGAVRIDRDNVTWVQVP